MKWEELSEDLPHTLLDKGKPYGMPEGDIDVLLEQLRQKDFTQFCRISEWRYTETEVLNYDGEVNRFGTYIAEFGYVNKWGQKASCGEYKIIYNNNMNVVWMGHHSEQKYFISLNDIIYNIHYGDTIIGFFPNACAGNEFIDVGDMTTFDDIIKESSWRLDREHRFMPENARIELEKGAVVFISIKEYFKKGFFYKGPKWTPKWSDAISILLNITAKDGLFQFEIENITYNGNQRDHVSLNLKEVKIMGTKKWTDPDFDISSKLESKTGDQNDK
jgi:hypothetical protein